MRRVPSVFFGAAVLMAMAVNVRAGENNSSLVVTMTNDASSNQLKVYDAATQTLVQTLPTNGKGGASGNARGIRAYHGTIVAAVNNASGTVALFRRTGNRLMFDKLVTTTSAPVSVDFGSGHMYVAGATSVDSFIINGDSIGWMDGTTNLVLVGGGVPQNGSTAQIGVVNGTTALVTLKTDPVAGTVDVISLRDGAVASAAPASVSAPAGTLTPFGFSVYPDGTALITLAHSNQDGLLRDGVFKAVISAGQTAPCWTTRVGKYVFTVNTGSMTISRVVGTGSNIFVDTPVAARIATGSPLDIDGAGGTMAVIDHGAGTSHLSLFTYNEFGELTTSGAPINVGVPNANGVAVVSPRLKTKDMRVR